MRKALKGTLAVTLIALLTACGGGGDSGSGSSGSTAEGMYEGILTNNFYPNFKMLVLENGEFWSLYGTQSLGVFTTAGFIQGTGQSNNGRFTTSNAKDFYSSQQSINVSSSAIYDATAKTISGNVDATTFNGSSSANSLYVYGNRADISTISGAWSATATTGESVALNVSASGTFTATSGYGCTFSGTVTPRASGKNVFDVRFTFGTAPCLLAGQSATGIAVAFPLSSGKTQLAMSAVNSSRTYGMSAYGTR